MTQLNVIKIGGHIIDDAVRLRSFLQAFAELPGRKVLVHGGGKVATDIGKEMGVESVYVSGRRVTDEATLRLVTMVYGGLVNKNIVAQMQAYGVNALGLTGADGNVIKANKRPVSSVDYGFVGDVRHDGVNVDLLSNLLEQGIVPVLAPLTHDGAGSMLNTNADTIAQEVAVAAASKYQIQLIYGFEKRGVLRHPDDESSVIAQIQSGDFQKLKDAGIISGGMIPKLENAFSAIERGVQKVMIGSAEQLGALIAGQCGTQIF